MAIFTEDNIVEYFPDLHNYGIQDFTSMIAKTEADIHRLLRIQWFPKVQGMDPNRIGLADYDSTRVNESQLTRSAVYYSLYKYILPQLTQWAVEGDSFQTQIDFYRSAFDEEFDLATRELIYDWNDDGSYEESERELIARQRLVR
jgi:hypothetical protein